MWFCLLMNCCQQMINNFEFEKLQIHLRRKKRKFEWNKKCGPLQMMEIFWNNIFGGRCAPFEIVIRNCGTITWVNEMLWANRKHLINENLIFKCFVRFMWIWRMWVDFRKVCVCVCLWLSSRYNNRSNGQRGMKEEEWNQVKQKKEQ